MRKLMLSAAIVALSATPALADDGPNGINIGITGEMKLYSAWVDQNGTGGETLRDVDMLRDTEVHFVGETTLDNGLTVGVDVGGDGDSGGDFDITDSFVYFSGDFGKLNAGATDGAAYLLQVQPPSADANYDGQEQYINPFNYSVTGITELEETEFDYDQDVTEAADKLTYITPVYDGFQAALSWTPEIRTASRSLNGVDDGTGVADVIDVAARFENETGWGSYSVGAGYTSAESRSLWNIAMDANIGAFGVGGLYTQDDQDEGDVATGATGQHQWIAGVDYTTGPYVIGASYLNQNNEFGADEINTDRYTAGVTYDLTHGVDVRGTVTYVDNEVDAGLGTDVDGTAILLGTVVSF